MTVPIPPFLAARDRRPPGQVDTEAFEKQFATLQQRLVGSDYAFDTDTKLTLLARQNLIIFTLMLQLLKGNHRTNETHSP